MAESTSKRQRNDELKDTNFVPSFSSCLDDIRRSTARVVRAAKHVSIDEEALKVEIRGHPDMYKVPPDLDWAPEGGYHYRNAEDPDLTAQYVLVLDALNFCFWPATGYEYAELAGSLKSTILKNSKAFSAESLSTITASEVTRWLQPSEVQHVDVPLAETRARLLNEVGRALSKSFSGLASNLIRSAQGSAANLVHLVTQHFPGFRDHAIYGGDQVFFYKRAQIFTADVFLCFKGQGLGKFSDIADLTCFADYRLPQLMFHLGVLKYDDDLKSQVLAKNEIIAGSTQELEIRAATVQCVEIMKQEIARVHQPLLSLQLDNLLWERGESQLSVLPPHHRTLTIYY